MATAAKQTVPLSAIALPKGYGDNGRRTFVNPQALATIQLIEEGSDGEPKITDLGQTPLGTKEIYVQHRMCGDFYCFIHGKKQVAAIGETRQEAFKNALKLAA